MSRKLFVHLLPTLFEPADLRGGTAVVIDLLRGSTTIIHALAAGAEAVIACGEVEEARRIAANLSASGPVLLGGERGGRLIEGFDLDNSPLAYTPGRVAGRTVVFTTTNGTRALAQCREADRVLVGAFANAGALVAMLASDERPVHLVCAGTDGEITGEDCLCAGALAGLLLEHDGGAYGANDAVRIAMDFYAMHSTNERKVWAAVSAGRGGRNLRELGFEADIDCAVERDVCEVVPEYDPRTGRITAPPFHVKR
jgi:2-phosphosulfolactate phosphatase